MKCRCKKTQQRLVAYSCEEEWPPDLRAAMEACPDCSAFWARTRQVAHLMALKRYEQPDEAALERCRAAVRRHVATLQEEHAGEAWESVWGPAPFVFRFGMAALLVALLGLHVLSSSPFPPLHTTERSLADYLHDAHAQAEKQVAQDERPNPEFTIMMLSNRAPRVRQDGAYGFVGFAP